jgi:hypothetical protein
MIKILLTLCLSGLLFLESFSQNFLPGYIITNDNTIIDGLINYGDKRQNFNRCVFIKDESSDRITLLPGDIKGYRFTDGKYFLSMKADSTASKSIFMEYLFDGIVDLYYCADNEGDHYYISKNGSSLSELRNDTRIIRSATQKAGISSHYSENNLTSYEKESKEYIGTLKVFFQDSPAVMRTADNTSLNVNSLLKISQDYHTDVCPGEECIIYSKKETRLRISFGPFIGISFSNISFTKNTPAFWFDTYEPGNGIFYGAFINLSDPHTSERLSLQLEASIFHNKYTSPNSLLNSVKLSTFKIPVLLKYTMPYKKIKPSILSGLMYNRFGSFKSNSDQYDSFAWLGGKDQIGLCAGAEIDFDTKGNHGIIFQARYEYLLGQHHIVTWGDVAGNVNSKVSNLNISCGYRF